MNQQIFIFVFRFWRNKFFSLRILWFFFQNEKVAQDPCRPKSSRTSWTRWNLMTSTCRYIAFSHHDVCMTWRLHLITSTWKDVKLNNVICPKNFNQMFKCSGPISRIFDLFLHNRVTEMTNTSCELYMIEFFFFYTSLPFPRIESFRTEINSSLKFSWLAVFL